MKVLLLSRSGNPVIKGGLELKDEASVADLQQAIFNYNRKWHPVRQRLTLRTPQGPAASASATSAAAPAAGPGKSAKKPPAVVLDAKKRLQDYTTPAAPVLEVEFKDLGPQVGYQTVFFWEYFGPMVIYPLFFLFPQVLYAPFGFSKEELSAAHTGPVQAWACAFWVGHYAKRIFETYFVHRFSHATMPVANLFRNCSYYWLFAAFVSYFVNHPRYTEVPLEQAVVGLSLGTAAELANFYAHIVLRNLRPPGSSVGYVIPKGFLFDQITCPNYTAEILAWLGFNIATQTVAGYLFMLAGGYQMTVWALQKHRRLVKLFDGSEGREKYPRRWVIMPPFL